MALLPLEAGNHPKADLKTTAEVRFHDFATEALWSKACHDKAEAIGRCVPFPKTTTYDWDRAADVMRITVEHRPDAV